MQPTSSPGIQPQKQQILLMQMLNQIVLDLEKVVFV